MKHIKDLSWKLAGMVYFAFVFMAVPFTAYAYIDPSVSSYLIQAVAGIVVAVGAFFTIYWRRAKKKVQDKLGIDDLRGETLFVIPENMQSDTIRNLQMYIDSRATGNLLIVGNTFFDLAALASAGYGIAILPRLMPQFGDEAAFVPFDYPERFYLGLFTRRDAPQDVRDFCTIAQEVCNPGDYVVAY